MKDPPKRMAVKLESGTASSKLKIKVCQGFLIDRIGDYGKEKESRKSSEICLVGLSEWGWHSTS